MRNAVQEGRPKKAQNAEGRDIFVLYPVAACFER